MRASKGLLRRRWLGEEKRIAAIIGDLKHDRDWTRRLLPSHQPKWGKLPHIDDSGRRILLTDAAPRDLRGINLESVDLSGTERLSDTLLDYARLSSTKLDGASLNGSSLCAVVLEGGTSLDGITAQFISLQDASCNGISLQNAELRNVNLARCDLRKANRSGTKLVDANLAGCDFRDADLRGTLFKRVKITEEGFIPFGRRPTRFGGRWQTLDDLSRLNRRRLRDYVARSSEIHELWQKRPLLAFARYIFSNFDRSATRFGLSTLGGLWFLFAALYAILPVEFKVGDAVRALSLCDAMYFSAITITTVGYGDISSAPCDGLARLLSASEALTGVIVLGVFIDRLVREQPRDWE